MGLLAVELLVERTPAPQHAFDDVSRYPPRGDTGHIGPGTHPRSGHGTSIRMKHSRNTTIFVLRDCELGRAVAGFAKKQTHAHGPRRGRSAHGPDGGTDAVAM